MRIGWGKRVASGITAAAMAFSYLLPFNGIPAAAADDCIIDVSFFDIDHNAAVLEAPANGYSYYTLVTIKDKNTDELAGWNVQSLSINDVSARQTFTEFNACDIYGAPTGDTIEFTAADYSVGARIYRILDDYTPGANAYVELRDDSLGHAVDTVPGYAFTNDAKADGSGRDITFTRANVTYAVDIDYGNASISPYEHIYLLVTAHHDGGEGDSYDTYYFKELSNDQTRFDVQTETDSYWMDADGNELPNGKDRLGGTETVNMSLYICQSGGLTKAGDIKSGALISEGMKVAGGEISFDEKTNASGGYQVTEYVSFGDVSVSNDTNFRKILGNAVNYGIVADEWYKPRHAQTNFAVNYYQYDGNVDQDLTGDNGGNIYIGYVVDFHGDKEHNENTTFLKAKDGYLVDLGASHCGPVTLYLNPDNIQQPGGEGVPSDITHPTALTDKGRQVDYGGWVTVEPTDPSVTAGVVNSMISHMQQQSRELAAHDATLDTYKTDRLSIVTTGFPDDATIYIDGDKMLQDLGGKVTGGNLLLEIKEGQTLVFNFKNTQDTIKLGEMLVNYHFADESDYEKYDPTNPTEPFKTNTAPATSMGTRNDFLEKLTKQLVWNFAGGQTVEIGPAAAGIFLNPDPDSEMYVPATSTGWICTAGYFENTGDEWHNVFTELNKVVETGYSVDLNKVDKSGNALSGATLAVYAYDPATGEETYVKSIVTGDENPNELKGLQTGKYIIRETKAPDGYALDENTEYYVEITEEKGQLQYNADGDHADYTKSVTVTVYEDKEFTSPTGDPVTYSPFEILSNVYKDSNDYEYTFAAGERETIIIYKDGQQLSDSEGNLYSFKLNPEGRTIIFKNGEEIREYSFGFETEGEAHGEVVSVYKGRNLLDPTLPEEELDPIFSDPVYTDGIYLYLLHDAGVENAKTVYYGDEPVEAVGGVYTVEGRRYNVRQAADGSIQSVTAVLRSGNGFNQVSYFGLQQNTDGALTLNYYANGVNMWGQGTVTATADLTADGDRKATGDLEGWGNVTVTYNTNPMGGGYNIQEVKVNNSLFNVKIYNYIVSKGLDILATTINISKKLTTPFDFTNEDAYTVKKIDSHGRPVKGAVLELQEEKYRISKEDNSIVSQTSAGTNILTWDSSNSSTTFELNDLGSSEKYIGSYSQGEANWKPRLGPESGAQYDNKDYDYTFYRLTETQVPENYTPSETDTIIAKLRVTAYVGGWGGGTQLLETHIYKMDVPRGEEVTTPLFNADFTINEAWTEVQQDSADSRTFTVTNTRITAKIDAVKVDAEPDDEGNRKQLAGAKFSLYRYTDGEEVHDPWLADFTTSEDGSTALETILNNDDLVAGIYYLVETEAPEGYDDTLVQNKTKLFFTVDSNRQVFLGKPGDPTEYPLNVNGSNGRYTIANDNRIENVEQIVIGVTGKPVYSTLESAAGGDYDIVYDDSAKTYTLTPKAEGTSFSSLLFEAGANEQISVDYTEEMGGSLTQWPFYEFVYSATNKIDLGSGVKGISKITLNVTASANEITCNGGDFDSVYDESTGEYTLTPKDYNNEKSLSTLTLKGYNYSSEQDKVLVKITKATIELTNGKIYTTEDVSGDAFEVLNAQITTTDGLTYSSANQSVVIPTMAADDMNSDAGKYIIKGGNPEDGYTFQITNTAKAGAKVKVGKVDAADNATFVADATIEVYKAGKTEEEDKLIQTIEKTSGTEATALDIELLPGVYYLVETAVPDDYSDDLLNVKQYFTVEEDLSITLGKPAVSSEDPKTIAQIALNGSDATDVDITVTMKLADNSTREYTKHFDSVGTWSEVFHKDRDGGAVTDVVSITVQSNAAANINVQDESWTNIESLSGEIAAGTTVFPKVESGEEETNALVLTEADGDGVITIKLPNTKAGETINISKCDLGGAPITAEGVVAKYTLTFVEAADGFDEEGNPVELDTDFTGVKVNGKEIEADDITSKDDGSKSVTIEGNEIKLTGLKDGKYTLKEEVAPDGYTVVESTFTFVVKNGVIDSVEGATTGDTAAGYKLGEKEITDAATGETTTVTDNTKIVVLDDISTISIDKKALGAKPLDDDNKATFKLYGDAAALEKVLDKSNLTFEDKAITGTQTDADGTYIEFDGNSAKLVGLNNGDYKLVESAAPDGYTLVTTAFTFTIENGVIVSSEAVTDGEITLAMAKDETHIVVNDNISTISINKKALGGEPIDAANKATFKLYGNYEMQLATVEVDEDNDGTGETKSVSMEDGRFFIEFTGNNADLIGLGDGTYTLKEETSPDGYTVVETEFTFVVENGVIVSSKAVTNGDSKEVIKANGESEILVLDDASIISISKTTLGGEPLGEDQKATFKLYGDAATLERVLNLSDELTYKGETITGTQTDADGTYIEFDGNDANLIGLGNGSYDLVESAAPDGYTIVETDFSFTILNGVIDVNSVTVTAADGKPGYKLGEKEVTDAATGETATVTDNTKIIAVDAISTIKVSKEALNADGTDHALDNTKPTEQAQYELGGKDVNKLVGVKVNGTEITADDIKEGVYKFQGNDVDFEGLKNGEYTLKEIVAPDGFTRVETTFGFTIANGVITDRTGETDGEIEVDADGNIVFTDKASVLTVDKKDSNGSYLANAWLKLTLTEASEKNPAADLSKVMIDGARKEAADPDGTAATANEIIWKSGTKSAVFSILPDGKYTLEEIKTPDDTYIPAQPKTFEVVEGKIMVDGQEFDGKVTVTNTKKGEIVIKKTDMTGEKELEGAELELYAGEYHEGDKPIATHTSGDEEWTVTLDAGTYTIVEVTAPDGYTIKAETKFEVDADGNVVHDDTTVTNNIVLVEDAPSNIVIDKTAFNAKPLEGDGVATFKLTFLDSTRTEFDDEGNAAAKKADFTGVTMKDAGADIYENAAKYLAKDDEGNVIDNVLIYTSNSMSFLNLKDGHYELEETAAPDGYTVVSKFEFTVDQGVITTIPLDETMTTGKVAQTENGLRIEDEISTITINKAALGSEPLSDDNKAEFKLYADDEESLTGVKVGDSETAAEVKKDEETGKYYIEFEGNTAELKGLKDATYTLEETVAPDGFTVVSSFTFTVDNGEITDKEIPVSNGKVEVTENGALFPYGS